MPIVLQHGQPWLFWPKFAQKWILRSKFQISKFGFEISTSKIPYVPVKMNNYDFFGLNLGKLPNYLQYFCSNNVERAKWGLKWAGWRWMEPVELGMSWVEVDWAGCRWLEVDRAGWRWVHGLVISQEKFSFSPHLNRSDIQCHQLSRNPFFSIQFFSSPFEQFLNLLRTSRCGILPNHKITAFQQN